MENARERYNHERENDTFSDKNKFTSWNVYKCITSYLHPFISYKFTSLK